MATPPKQTQGKRKPASQPSLISSYFKRVDAPSTQKSQSTAKEHANGPWPQSASQDPEPSTATCDDALESDDTERTSKRPRLATPPPSSEPSRPTTPTTSGQRNALTALMSPKAKEFRPPPESPRTARYKYTGPSAANAEEPSTPEQIAKKKTLHDKFVAKLGRPESMALLRRKSQGEGSQREDEDEEGRGREDEGEEEEEVSLVAESLRGKYVSSAGKKTAPSGKKSTASSTTKFTPLERQYVDIKKQCPDTLLLIEVGYKFRFFGEDAKIASKELGIAHFMSHNFFTASIPVPRLLIHVKRLVTAGHKVGVVRQTETAALKAVGDNKSAPFERKLTNLYTKGTYIDDFNIDDELSAMAPSTGYIMCIVEDPGGGSGTDERVNIGMVAVQPSTGDVVYDAFEDGFMRGEFETRALHLQPSEIILAGNLSKATIKVLSHLSIKTQSSSEAVRTEYVPRPKTLDAAKTSISAFYTSNPTILATLLEKILSFPRLTLLSLSALLTYISDFGLQNVFTSKYFSHFSSRASMLLNGSTISSLEIYRNQTDFSEKGSLLWVLDHTRTKFGRRMLRKWIGRPLLAKSEIEARLAAVQEVKESTNYKLEDIATLLSHLPDLEKGLVRIHYGRCSRPELLSILQALSRVASKFPLFDTPEAVGFKSPILNEAVYSLPTIATDIVTFLSTFHHKEAAADNKFEMFREDDPKFEAIQEHKMAISAVETDLHQHLLEIRKMLKHSKLVYVTVAGIEYLVELRNTDVARVPKNWVKIVKLLQEREQQKESLAVECDRAYSAFLREISEKYEFFRDIVQNLGVLDCLLSLAAVASLPGYAKPEFVDDGGIEVVGARHPMVEQILVDAYVPNDIQLKHEETRALILTGPNMGGKSCYIRSVALISIMAQIGSYVPCESAKLTLIDGVYTRMGAFDNMLRGESTFMYEMNETSDIMKAATSKSLVVLDEIGRGTATFDGLAIAQAVLRYFVEDTKCLTLFVTHYPQIREIANEKPLEVRTFHMGFMEAQSQDGSPEVTFLYKLTPGIAHRSYGLNVASLANLPAEVISIAAEKARILEEETKLRERERWNEKARDLVKSETIDIDILKELAKRINQ